MVRLMLYETTLPCYCNYYQVHYICTSTYFSQEYLQNRKQKIVPKNILHMKILYHSTTAMRYAFLAFPLWLKRQEPGLCAATHPCIYSLPTISIIIPHKCSVGIELLANLDARDPIFECALDNLQRG